MFFRCDHFFLLLFILKYYTLVHFSDSMNPQYPCKICKNEVKDNNPSVCCDICNMCSHIECVNITSKTYVNLWDHVVSARYCPICVRSLPFSDLRTKELKIFLSSDAIEHTQEPQKAPKRLNKQTHKLIKKFSQISQMTLTKIL